MYKYTIEKVTRLSGTDTVTAIIDLGFSVKTKVSFKLNRVETPEMDFFSETDPEFNLRGDIIRWLKSAPKPLYVSMQKNGKEYVGEITDKNGRVLADDLSSSTDVTTQIPVINYDSHATADPAGF